jgi:hypothetical protein
MSIVDEMANKEDTATTTVRLSLSSEAPASLSVFHKAYLRKSEGLKRRRENLAHLHAQMQHLREANHQLKIENKELKRTRPVSPPRISPITLLLSNVSPTAKRRATD